MEPYRHHVTGNPRPASTYRGARRNAARSGKAQILKKFRLWASGWQSWPELNCGVDLRMPIYMMDRWRHNDPKAYQHWWHEFCVA
jgi:hypothetical protein